VMGETAYKPHLGPSPSKGGGASEQKMSVLDYLTEVCRTIGHTIRVDGDSVIIQTVRALMSGSLEGRADDPWQPRTVDGKTVTYRQFIYGRNIRDLRIERNFSKHVPTNVEVRCNHTARKKDLVAKFPTKEDRLAYALPGNAKPDQKWAVYVAHGVTDEKTLRILAQGIYEELGRHEVVVEVKTRNLASFGGDNTDPDILDMKVGDTFEFLVNRTDDEAASITSIEKALTAQEQNKALIKARGLSDEFAAQYAKAYTNAGFLTQFKMKSMKVDWSLDEGVTLEVVGCNYVVVRADLLLPKGEETSATITVTSLGTGAA